MKNFWNKLKQKGPIVALAPMDGYTDSAYRQTVKQITPNVICFSEFYSADGLVYSKFLADSVLPHNKSEEPLIIQIFGKNPEIFIKAAKIIEQDKYNITGIDINMGCPAKKVIRSGHGSDLIINTDTAFKIVEELNKATKLPISVKTRISFDGNQDLISFGKGLESAGASLITVHGRTQTQMYTGIANWDPIYELKKNLNIPIIGNGDCIDYDDGIKRINNLDGFMIGRGSFGNPWCFLPGKYNPSIDEILDTMIFHATKLVETKGEKKGSLEIRKHLVQYLKGFPGVKTFRKELVTTESLENSMKIIRKIRKHFD